MAAVVTELRRLMSMSLAIHSADANPPLVTSEEANQDINAVVNWIRDRNSAQQVALAGEVTGGHWAGMYTSQQR